MTTRIQILCKLIQFFVVETLFTYLSKENLLRISKIYMSRVKIEKIFLNEEK
jgi:hypothetical protein